MTDDSYKKSDEASGRPDDAPDTNVDAGYEPSYSEPNYGTSGEGSDWEVPTTSEPVADDDTTHASPPDASPLTEQHSSGASTPPPAPWWDSAQNGPGSGATGATSYGQPPNAQGAPGQQGGQWSGQGQQYQPGPPPMGGMPPQQPYAGGYAPMTTGPNNPYWLAGPSEQGRNTLQLDYWLSVFFSWIPSLIFFLTEKDKNKLMDEHTKELLNFNITRVIVGAVTAIPFIGWIVGGIGSIVLFVMAILGAMKGPDDYANGRVYQFPLTFRFIK